MDVTPLVRDGQQIIQSYGAGVFRISSISYETAVFVQPNQTKVWSGVNKPEDLEVEDFQFLIDNISNIDVILLGTGDELFFLSNDFRQKLRMQGMSVDVMDTGAACRTYNVLMAEGRRVVAALLPTAK